MRKEAILITVLASVAIGVATTAAGLGYVVQVVVAVGTFSSLSLVVGVSLMIRERRQSWDD